MSSRIVPTGRRTVTETGDRCVAWGGRPWGRAVRGKLDGPTLPAVAARRGPDDRSGERGSALPFVLVCWLVAAVMALGAIAASDAFLEQRDLQAACDGAALAAANRADEGRVYAAGVGAALPLTTETAQAAVADHLADGGTVLDTWSAETDGTEVTVRCGRSVPIAFGWLFLGGRPLEVGAVAGARAPAP
jgi:putative Flp pilus-assembly TadE/G-like protein